MLHLICKTIHFNLVVAVYACIQKDRLEEKLWLTQNHQTVSKNRFAIPCIHITAPKFCWCWHVPPIDCKRSKNNVILSYWKRKVIHDSSLTFLWILTERSCLFQIIDQTSESEACRSTPVMHGWMDASISMKTKLPEFSLIFPRAKFDFLEDYFSHTKYSEHTLVS